MSKWIEAAIEKYKEKIRKVNKTFTVLFKVCQRDTNDNVKWNDVQIEK